MFEKIASYAIVVLTLTSIQPAFCSTFRAALPGEKDPIVLQFKGQNANLLYSMLLDDNFSDTALGMKRAENITCGSAFQGIRPARNQFCTSHLGWARSLSNDFCDNLLQFFIDNEIPTEPAECITIPGVHNAKQCFDFPASDLECDDKKHCTLVIYYDKVSGSVN